MLASILIIGCKQEEEVFKDQERLHELISRSSSSDLCQDQTDCGSIPFTKDFVYQMTHPQFPGCVFGARVEWKICNQNLEFIMNDWAPLGSCPALTTYFSGCFANGGEAGLAQCVYELDIYFREKAAAELAQNLPSASIPPFPNFADVGTFIDGDCKKICIGQSLPRLYDVEVPSDYYDFMCISMVCGETCCKQAMKATIMNGQIVVVHPSSGGQQPIVGETCEGDSPPCDLRETWFETLCRVACDG